MILPPKLRRDDIIHVMHAAGRADRDALERGIARLRAAGFSVVSDPALPMDVGAPPGTPLRPYLAAPDPVRLGDVIAALTREGIGAAISARGGYGSMRLLPALEGISLATHPRWIIGYSDITALHLWAWRQGVASLHAPLVAGLGGADDATFDALVAAICEHRFPSFDNLRSTSVCRASGPLLGGNLSIIAALCGTRWMPGFEGTIAFFEEVGEPRYRVDRLLTQLVLAGALDNVAGVALGRFTPVAGETEADLIEVALEQLRPLGVPIVAGVAAGHHGANLPLLIGGRYEIDGAAGRLAPIDGVAATRPPVVPRQSVVTRVGGSAGRVLGIVEDAVRRGICSAIAVEASVGDDIAIRLAAGATARVADVDAREVGPRTRFDLASLTKPLATAIVAHHLVERGRVGLDDVAPAHLSAARATLRQLLRHTSGLPAHVAVFEQARLAPDPLRFARERFASIEPEAMPDERHVYSDVGYVALGRWLEMLGGASLGEMFAAIVAAPLALGASFSDGATNRFGRDVAATEFCRWRGVTLHGIVHDENAQVLGGSAGHAGLFGTATDVGAIARSLLGFGNPVLSADAVERMWNPASRFAPGKHVLGWDTPGSETSMAGRRLRHDSTVGHLGFTGTSVWIERERQIVLVVLTNRVHPCRDETRIRELRPVLNDALIEALTG